MYHVRISVFFGTDDIICRTVVFTSLYYKGWCYMYVYVPELLCMHDTMSVIFYEIYSG